MSAPLAPRSRGARSGLEPHDDRRTALVRALVPVVEALLQDQSYPQLTVERLAESAGISRSTFYNYFADAADLLRALTGDVMGQILEASQIWWQLPADASRQEFRDAIQGVTQAYAPHATLMWAVSDSIEHDPGVRSEYNEMMARGADGLAGYIRRGQLAGTVREQIDPESTAWWLVSMLERGLLRLATRHRDEWQGSVEVLVAVLWKGLRS